MSQLHTWQPATQYVVLRTPSEVHWKILTREPMLSGSIRILQLKIKTFQCYEVKRNSDNMQLPQNELSVLCYWFMTSGQTPSPKIPYIYIYIHTLHILVNFDPNGVPMVHTEWPRYVTKTINIICAVHLKNCEGWWSSSCQSSMVEHRQLKPGALGSHPGNCGLFVCFCIKMLLLNHYYSNLRMTQFNVKNWILGVYRESNST